MQVKAQELIVGMGLKTWFGTHTIRGIYPYEGPFDFVLCVVHLSNGADMSIEKHLSYDIE